MDKIASQIPNDVYISVLHKLKHILVNGYHGMDEIRYVYDWHKRKSRSSNIRLVDQENAALRYFLEIGVIDGMQSDNEFRRQQLYDNVADKQLGVWGQLWHKADPAYREYHSMVHIYRIDPHKLADECRKFGLEDAGLELIRPTTAHRTGLPKVLMNIGKDFKIHAGEIISYKDSEIKLEPQDSRIATHIMRRGVDGLYTTLNDIAVSCLSETYLEKAGGGGDESRVNGRIWRCIHDIRTAFRLATGKEECFPIKRGAGYTFKP